MIDFKSSNPFSLIVIDFKCNTEQNTEHWPQFYVCTKIIFLLFSRKKRIESRKKNVCGKRRSWRKSANFMRDLNARRKTERGGLTGGIEGIIQLSNTGIIHYLNVRYKRIQNYLILWYYLLTNNYLHDDIIGQIKVFFGQCSHNLELWVNSRDRFKLESEKMLIWKYPLQFS